MTDKIMTLHPEGKNGVNIDTVKYNLIKAAIIEALQPGSVTFIQLVETIQAQLADAFDGSIPWYVTTVKLDLEARHMIERIPGTQSQQLRLVT